MTLIKSFSGATLICSVCGTQYDAHGVDVEDCVPQVGDGCEECDSQDEFEAYMDEREKETMEGRFQ